MTQYKLFDVFTEKCAVFFSASEISNYMWGKVLDEYVLVVIDEKANITLVDWKKFRVSEVHRIQKILEMMFE